MQQVALRELTCTGYVSTCGARAVTRHAWQSGEFAQITSLKAEISIHGEIAHCPTTCGHPLRHWIEFPGAPHFSGPLSAPAATSYRYRPEKPAVRL